MINPITYFHFDIAAPIFAAWVRHRACFFRGPRLGYGDHTFENSKCIHCNADKLVSIG